MTPRLAELLAGLSRFADLGFGLEPGTAARSSVLAVRLAQALGCADDDARAAYYVSLLHHVGCVGYARETARLLGDEVLVNRAVGRADQASSRRFLSVVVPALGRDRSALERARLALTIVSRGQRWGSAYTATACEVGGLAARRLGLPDGVEAGLLRVYDLWRDHGDGIPIAARIARVAGLAALFDGAGGTGAAIASLQERRGGMLDPEVVDAFTMSGAAWLAEISDADPTELAVAAEPEPAVTVSSLIDAAQVFGDLADLKSPYLAGHSRAVATIAVGAGRRLQLAETHLADLDVASMLHDVGCVAISNRIWDKAEPLTRDEWEQVRLHPYYSERIIAATPHLALLAPLVGRHHERLDGTGYHRGCTASDLSMSARVLAVAVAYRTSVEPRPHRSALGPDAAAAAMLDGASAGVFDPDAVRAVLSEAGQVVGRPTRSLAPAGLSEREVEVVRLLARGCSNAEIGSALTISRRTAEHHVQHVYAKIGVSSRAGVTMFAVEHGLVG